jgi:predicted ATP-binding protein involved in virulence
MKIRKLHLQNYKVFDDAEFDFTDSEGKTLDTIVLAGANGCGKTTVLELFAAFFANSFELESEDINIKTEWEISKAEKQAISSALEETNLGIDERKIVQNGLFNGTDVSIFALNKDEDSLLNLFSFEESIEYNKQVKKEWLVYFPVSNREDEESSILKILHLESHKSEMEEMAIKAVQRQIFLHKNITPQATIDAEIKDLNFILKDFNLATKLVDIETNHFVFKSPNGKSIYFDELSNGEKHFYFNAIYLYNLQLENSIILIDEPESALHPSWQKAILKLYQKIGKNNQVILATHSPHIMASVKPESLFVLHLDKEHNKVQILNMGKEGKHSKGLEPNRILTEIMEVENLREFETQQSINRLSQLLNIQQFDSEEAQVLLEKLQVQLGQQDSFIIRANHQMLMLNRQKEKQNALRS